mmetsp:Transcript_123113/g.223823  ORF Transcript_123113/g.223823 Transcript_123113/m.223823 type:complete len:245 (+) Transcript_123113:103-837(+)
MQSSCKFVLFILILADPRPHLAVRMSVNTVQSNASHTHTVNTVQSHASHMHTDSSKRAGPFFTIKNGLDFPVCILAETSRIGRQSHIVKENGVPPDGEMVVDGDGWGSWRFSVMRDWCEEREVCGQFTDDGMIQAFQAQRLMLTLAVPTTHIAMTVGSFVTITASTMVTGGAALIIGGLAGAGSWMAANMASNWASDRLENFYYETEVFHADYSNYVFEREDDKLWVIAQDNREDGFKWLEHKP